jgi:hypothetical protein
VAQQKDQVFQLSLTEIAFIITFLLLLLLGFVIVKVEADRDAAEAKLATVQANQQAAKAMATATKELTQALGAGGATDPAKVISALVAADTVREDRDRLRQKVDELNTKLTALVALEERLAKAAPSERASMTTREIVAALELQEQVAKTIAATKNTEPQKTASGKPGTETPAPPSPENQPASAPATHPVEPPIAKTDLLPLVRHAIKTSETLKTQLRKSMSKELTPGREEQEIGDVVNAASDFAKLTSNGTHPGTIARENSDLRGQVAFLKHRLDARGGRDFPPCWADETGKVEFLFALETKSDSVTITQSWPERRAASARALPGISEALNGPHTHRDFPARVQALFNWSKTQDPECRHYVQLKSSIADAVQSDRARLMIENYFYKVEARR